MSDEIKVTADSLVSLNFAIHLSDGSVVDSNFDQPPCSFKYGDGRMLPGFELALLGMATGERRRLSVPAERGFGEWQEDRQNSFPSSKFKGYELEPGLVLSFADPSGERPGVVRDIQEDKVVIDFNHPLAGKELVFDVLIHSIENNPS